MNTSNHLRNNPKAANGAASQASLSRDVTLAGIVVAILLTGIGAGGAVAPQPDEQAVVRQQSMTARWSRELIYFPDQFVNEGTELTEHIQAF